MPSSLQATIFPPVPRPRFARRLLAIACCVSTLALSSSPAAAAESAPRSFDLPAGLAETTLKLFSEQSGHAILAGSAVVQGVKTNPVKGEFAAGEALGRMLAGTSLVATADEQGGAFSLRRTDPGPNEPTASGPKPRVRPGSQSPEPLGETIELSPFEVVADSKGYFAPNTMSGTRLNSALEDLGASISVITKQQMEDLALLDINDVFLYMGSTEGTGQYTQIDEVAGRGEISDATAADPTNANRIRGIGAANVSNGNFETSKRVPLDPLDSDGVEISRGPNSSVFGLGNPSGTVNIIGATANLQRDRSTLAFRADSFDGWRASLDLNRVLLKDRLALRVSGVRERTGFDLKPSGVDTKRFNAMLAYMPFKKTILRASYQYYHAEGTRPNSIPPQDGISDWRELGSPTWVPLQNSIRLNGVLTPFNNRADSPTAYTYVPTSNYGLQYVDREGIAFWGQIYGAAGGTSPLGARQTTRKLVATTALAQDNQPLIGRRTTVITDRNIYDWKALNIYSQNRFEDKTETLRVTLDQIFLDSSRQTLAAQAGWFHEDSDRFQRFLMADGSTQGTTGVLSVDINETLLDGTPNPFFLRPFIFQAEPRIRNIPVRNDTYRLQLAYKLDFSQDGGWRKWLGSHSLVGYGEYKEKDQRNFFYREDIISTNPWTFANDTANRQAGQPVREFLRFYLGDNVGQNIEYAPGPVNYGNYTYTYGDALKGTFTSEPITLGLAPLNHNGTNTTLKTGGVLLQSHLWQGRIVTTFGKRKDENRTKRYNLGNTAAALENRGFDFNLDFLDQFRDIPTEVRNGSAVQKGVVVKPFRGWNFIERPASGSSGLTRFLAQAVRGLNVHYNESSSFLPEAPALNVFQNPLPDPRGKGKDYGFSLNLFDGNLYIKVNKYSTKTLNSRNGPSASIAAAALALDFTGIAGGVEFSLSQKSEEWIRAANPGISDADLIAQQTALIGISPKDRLEFTGITSTETDDILSRGHEIELHFNPVNYWTLTANFTEQQTINTRLGTNVSAYVEQRLPFWSTIVDPTNGVLWFDNKYTVNETQRAQFNRAVAGALQTAQALEGHARPQIRRYRANLATTFRLSGISNRSFLRRIALTGAARYESKASIGFLGDPDADGIYRTFDVNRSIYDKGHINLDAGVSYRTKLWGDKVSANFQLNVRNLNESGRLQPINALVTGEIFQYRIIAPRQFILTASFDL